jgi:uncharacterized protein with von Willebrand factor type A (vWA) domain
MAAALSTSTIETIGGGARLRLVGFVRTLRDNAFRVGLAETRDALRILGSPAAASPTSLKPALRALFAATHSDWTRFDEIFDAYWLGTGMRSTRLIVGQGQKREVTKLLTEPGAAGQGAGLADQLRRADDADASGSSRREGASREETLRKTIWRISLIPMRSTRRTRLPAVSPARCERG